MKCIRLFAVLTAFFFSSANTFLLSAQRVSLPAVPVEDWSTPVVNRAALGTISSAVIGTSQMPEFTREVIRVQWRAGDAIDLFVIQPHGVQKPPVILYLYGYPNDTNRFWEDGWCRRVTQGGFAAVGFVSALTGQRYMNRPMKEWFVSQLQESLGTTTHDVQMVLDYLTRRGDLTTTEVGMYGQGSGGTVALLAAAVDPRIVAVDVLDPWGDWPDWFTASPEVPDDERPTYLKPEFLRSVENLDPVKYLPGLNLKALRVQQVLAEPVTPAKAKMILHDASQRSGNVVDYKTEREHLEAWRVSGLSGWLRAQMRPATACTTPVQTTATTAAVETNRAVPPCPQAEKIGPVLPQQ